MIEICNQVAFETNLFLSLPDDGASTTGGTALVLTLAPSVFYFAMASIKISDIRYLVNRKLTGSSTIL